MPRKRLTPINPDAKPVTYDIARADLRNTFRLSKWGSGLQEVKTPEGVKFTCSIYPQSLRSKDNLDGIDIDRIQKYCHEHGMDYKWSSPPAINPIPIKPGRLSVWWEGPVPEKDYGYGEKINQIIRELLRMMTFEERRIVIRKGKEVTVTDVMQPSLSIKPYAKRVELWFSSPHVNHKVHPNTFRREPKTPVKPSPFDCVDKQLQRARYDCVAVAMDWCRDHGYKVEFGFKKWVQTSGGERHFKKGEDRPMCEVATELLLPYENEEGIAQSTTDITVPGPTYVAAQDTVEMGYVPDPTYHPAIVVTLPLE